jgi:hypothetical protein
MKHGWMGSIELCLVLLFVLGWGVLELVTARMDKRKQDEAAAVGGDSRRDSERDSERDSKGDSRHPKG